MITTDSRYRSAVIQTVQGPSSTVQEMAIAFPVGREIQYTYYRVKQGDRVDILAFRFLGNPNFWWIIADANPEYLQWVDLPVGKAIRIPSA